MYKGWDHGELQSDELLPHKMFNSSIKIHATQSVADIANQLRSKFQQGLLIQTKQCHLKGT